MMGPERDTTAPQPFETRYAVVVVDTHLTQRRRPAAQSGLEADEGDDPLVRAFHYSIPDDLVAILEPGHLVWVPFGARYLQGLVVALDAESPVEDTRDIDRLIDPQPMLSPNQLQLARWISTHYFAPLHQVLWSMIPPGITGEAQIVVEAAEDGADDEQDVDLTPGQKAILAIVQDHGPLPVNKIAMHAVPRTWRTMLRHLISLGLVEQRVALMPAAVKPLYQEFIRLCADRDPEEEIKPSATRQRAVVDFCRSWGLLQGDPDGWIMRLAVQRETGASLSTIRTLVDKGLLELTERQVWRDPLAGRSFVPVVPPRLTPDQEAIWHRIEAQLECGDGPPFLLQGVTGSGKTEIYLRSVQRVLARGQSAIVLVPEIALTPQTVRRFGARHPSTLAVMHSELSGGERYDQWRRIRSGDLRLVIGSRSAIFSPVHDLGLIVLDEEHEWTYKQERTPRYHAREVAVHLAEITGATVILGSATPSIESAYRAERGEFTRLTLPQRIMGHRRVVDEQASLACAANRAQHPPRFRPISDEVGQDTLHADLPPVEVVDLRAELRAGNTSIFSRALCEALSDTLAMSEQAILFLNRRGSASFVICRDCGYVVACPRCEVPLTYHGAEQDLVCHHCNLRQAPLQQCPECFSRRIRYFGLGTQRVESLVQELFPDARVVRWDYDATRSKGSHEAILDQFIRGDADIMVGTQMVAKGLDLPRVTLVGVVSADTLLNLPEFTAGERTFQLLTQVAGRAGRSVLGGKVITQTYLPNHPAVLAASAHDYETFYAQEIAFRREHWYPPLSRMIRLIHAGRNARRVEHEAQAMHRALEERIARLGLPEVDLIGPAPAFYERLRGQWRWHILVRGTDPATLLRELTLPMGWRIDVDPVSLL